MHLVVIQPASLLIAASVIQQPTSSSHNKGNKHFHTRSRLFSAATLPRKRPHTLAVHAAGPAAQLDGSSLPVLLQAAMAGDEPAFKAALAPLDPESRQDQEQAVVALFVSCMEGHESLVRLLVHGVCVPVDVQGPQNETPLMVAAGNGHTSIIALLLEAGADVAAVDSAGGSALFYACGSGKVEAARMLLEAGAAIDATDSKKCTPLLLCVFRNQVEAARLLLDCGAVYAASVASDGSTPLMAAAAFGAAPMCRLLLDRGADVRAASSWGGTALHDAAAVGCCETVELLLQAGADPCAATEQGWTPLMLGVGSSKGTADVVKLLLTAGADAKARDSRGQSAADWGREAGNDALVALLG